MTASLPCPGLIGLTPVHGDVGKFIEIGQWLNGDGFKAWEHAFISLGNGLIAEAEPGGARVAHYTEYSVIHWCERLAYHTATGPELQAAANAAKRYAGPGPWGNHGVPYSFLDYLALAQHRLHIPGPGLQQFVASSGHMICSQLCDRAYQDAGIHLFTDNRWNGYVTPADLYNLDASLPAVPATWQS